MPVNKFYAFYTWAYNSQPKREDFATVDEVERFYKKVMDIAGREGTNPYLGLSIVYGELCQFEPIEVVQVWRLKETVS